ncbi:hypothetical protein V7087_21210 [Neobacillus niacini]|uniref:hypothetical protein n=1 Tax=Neobacillus niacini TaxID=86668 RepID=UPI002FFED8B4
MNSLFSLFYILGVYYLISYQLKIKKAADSAREAIFPKTKSEFDSILIPTEWKEMEPLTKKTKSYRLVKWGTITALVLLSLLLWMVISTNWIKSSFFTLAYLFFAIINLIHHRGNLYILQRGLILFGKYYSFKRVNYYEVEKIVRWHELYGLDSSVNNGYKLTIIFKKQLFSSSKFVVIKDFEHLKQIVTLFEGYGIRQSSKSQN